MVVTISCAKLKNKFNKPITVTTNDPRNPTVKLTCAGQILEPANVHPRSLQFGKISRRAPSQTLKVELTKGDGGPIAPRIANTDALAGLDAKIVEVKAGERYELEATLHPPYPGTRVTKSIEIETGVKEAPSIRVAAFATFQPRVLTQPYRIQLPKEGEADGWEGRVKLVWDDDKIPAIKEVSINEPGLSARAEEKDGEQWIVVTKNEKYEPVITPRLVTVLVDDKETPSIRIPVSAPRSAVSPTVRRARSSKVPKGTPPRVSKTAPATDTKTQHR